VRLSLIEKEDMISVFSLIFGAAAALLLLAVFILNRRTTTALFAPFYRTLAQMQDFSLRSETPPALEDTRIDEFRELNTILSQLMARARKEYSSAKEFSANASHELQTPLAIVTSKLDLLIQKENLDEEERQLIASMYHTIGRLTQLTKTLLLLSQIETAGYFESTDVDIAREVLNELEAIAPVAEYKNITITRSIAALVVVQANAVLAGILVKNILSNAVRHNTEGGTVAVRLDERSFSVENTGAAPCCTTAELFERFRKSGASDDSVGLGLAAVKEICALYRFGIEYVYADGIHRMTVTFP
jgi:signal transduction histidine kinase